MTIVSHNTDQMRDWSGTMEEHSNNYDTLVEELYRLVDQFANSSDFSGGLSADFAEAVISQRDAFYRYSETFRECADLINSTATNIDSDEAELKGMINNANPLG